MRDGEEETIMISVYMDLFICLYITYYDQETEVKYIILEVGEMKKVFSE